MQIILWSFPRYRLFLWLQRLSFRADWNSKFYILGYPNGNKTYQALEGVISFVQLENKGRMGGSSGSQRGYCG
ncbi:unnamed protein product [Caenorhabditis nigoni]